MNLLKTKLLCFLLLAPFFLQAQARDSTEVARAVDSLISNIDLRIQKNDFRMAKRICKDARQLAVETWGQRSEHEAKCMFQEARLLRATEQLDSSEHTYLAAGEILLSKFGATSDEYLSVVNNLSGLYKQMGRFVEAERLLNQILDACKSNPTTKESLCLKAEFNLGSVYRQLARYPESEAMLRSLLANPVFKNDTVQYRTALSTLASNYSILGKYQASDSLYQTVLAQYAASAGRESAEYARELTNLINLYDDRGDLTRAIDTASVALAIYKKIYGDNHPMYARILSNTASIFAGIGDYTQAEALQKKALDIRTARLCKDHPDYAASLQNLGAIYSNLGRAGEAEAMYYQALELQRRKFGDNHPYLATTQGNLGTLYARLGIFDKAERYMQMSLEVMRRSLGATHSEYARTLNNLSILYSNMGDEEKAVSCITQSIHIAEAAQGSNHPATIARCISLASLLRDIEPHRADSLTQAIQIQMIRLNLKEHKEYLRLLKCMADIRSQRGEYEEAAKGYAAIFSTTRARFGDDYPDNGEYALQAARCYLALGRADAALPYLIITYTSNKRRLEQSLLFLSEKELLSYTGKLTACFNLMARARFATDTASAYLDALLLDNLLIIKEIALQSSIKLKQAVQSDTMLQRLADALRMLQVQLDAAYQNPNVSRNKIATLEWQADSIQKIQIRAAASSNAGLFASNNLNSGEAMCAGEVAVEFAHFQWPRNDGSASDSVLYYALVQFPGRAKPHFIPLFEEKKLAALLEKSVDDARQASSLYAAARSGELLGAAPSYGTALYNLIWRPIDSLLNSPSVGGSRGEAIKTVYFSPSGLLHRVSFAALPINEKKVLSDKYELHQLGSTRSLVVKTPEPVAQNYTAAVFGGVQYDRKDNTPADSTAPEITDNRLWTLIEHPRASSEGGFDYLPGTAQEAASLTRALQAQRVRTQTHTGAQASEEMLKSLGRDTVKSPDILHIATHGFFFPDPEKRKDQRFGEENAFKWNENPLFRSGLALAGANAAWSGQPAPGNIEDGIATAYEISHLNLSNTKLVVLSACESGLGDIKGSEGVYGLQRAFKMAGADYLLVSLWQVPDKETVEFMDLFYKSWLGGKTIHEAFAKAQKKMRKKYKEVYKWGAWVLVE
jgi:CHAT domain-containing protein/Flp pilus assembly protein TadD